MLKIKTHLGVLVALALAMSSCSEEGALDETSSVNENIADVQLSSRSSRTPWDFDSSYSTNDDFQVDNDGRGSHNWDEDDYEDDPNDNGFDIRDYIYVDGSDRLILQCPRGSNRAGRRAEYRDQTNIDLDRRNRMDLTFDVRNYDNRDELILAQMHNDDSRVRRPYLTIQAEDGWIELQRRDNFNGSGTTTSSSRIRFRQNDRYRIRMDSPNNSRRVDVRINNLDTGEQARQNFTFDSSWNSVDGSFYWKHGAYMPDGGSEDTRQRVETISFATNRTN